MHFDTTSARPSILISSPKKGDVLCSSLSLILCAFTIAFSQASETLPPNAPEPILQVSAPFEVPEFKRPVFADRNFDIRDFGATEGGVVKNSESIRKAIEAAVKAGGGRVVVPAGVWLTGAIHLESNVNLNLAKGAELLFSQDPIDYLPAVFSRHEETECYKYSAFIYADRKSNIAITGEGTLNGQGKPWWAWKESRKNSEQLLEEMASKNVPVRERVFDGTNGRILRPAFFQPMNCSNVLVEGVTFLYGAFWTIAPTYCNNVIIRRVKITTEGSYGHTPNGDGVDPSSSKNVLIEYCKFDTGDDCIAIKSGRDKDGLRVGVPTENVIVRHCEGWRGHGGISIGSETSGGIRNIYATDCRFHGTERVVRIKTTRGRGGTIEHLWFHNLSADTSQQEVLGINMLYTGTRLPAEKVTETTPRIQDVHFSNIFCSNGKKGSIEIVGLPEMPVESVTFDSIAIVSAKGIACTDADKIQFRNIDVMQSEGPLISIIDCTKLSVDRMQIRNGISPLVYADGDRTSDVSISNTKGAGRAVEVQYGPTINHGAVKIQ